MVHVDGGILTQRVARDLLLAVGIGPESLVDEQVPAQPRQQQRGAADAPAEQEALPGHRPAARGALGRQAQQQVRAHLGRAGGRAVKRRPEAGLELLEQRADQAGRLAEAALGARLDGLHPCVHPESVGCEARTAAAAADAAAAAAADAADDAATANANATDAADAANAADANAADDDAATGIGRRHIGRTDSRRRRRRRRRAVDAAAATARGIQMQAQLASGAEEAARDQRRRAARVAELLGRLDEGRRIEQHIRLEVARLPVE